jgi:hypothetical protein
MTHLEEQAQNELTNPEERFIYILLLAIGFIGGIALITVIYFILIGR